MMSKPTIQTKRYPKRKRQGRCPFCGRETFLSFHHLIPKKMHRRSFFKKHYNKAQLAAGIDICRTCHDGIHKTYSEMELAKSFNSFERLQQDERLQAYFAWVAKQRIAVKYS